MGAPLAAGLTGVEPSREVGIGGSVVLLVAAGEVSRQCGVADPARLVHPDDRRGRRARESRLFFALVWGLVLIGCAVLLLGLSQPIVLLVISACVGGAMMAIHAALLLVLNRRVLPEGIGITAGRAVALGWAVLLFGVLAGLTIIDQIGGLLGG